MKFIEVDYNEDLKPLETLLSGVRRTGDFFVSGVLEMPMPKVEVETAGPLSFPIPDAQIAALVRQAERAPYGRGEKTIVDTSVRKVWQIGTAKVKISGKSWAANFEAIVSKVSLGLGCEGLSVSAELYKLLIYDKDGFFLPHRDTEKTNGMFGTLVVTLPSAHHGGELRLRHAGREVTVDASAAEFSEVSYVAFYADCEHEALPVLEGNRVCLVYNLIQNSRKGTGKTLKAPDHEARTAEAAAVLDRFLRGSDAPSKIAWLLEHQYSPAGLSFAALKGADAARAGVLVHAAERAKCVAHLGIVHIWEFGAAEPNYDDYFSRSRSRWNRYRDNDEDDESEDEDEGEGAEADFTAVSVDDGWKYIDEWRDVRDVAAEFGPIPLSDRELLPHGALDGEPPEEKRLTEASGNEGATYERSYHRAVLVLWPHESYSDVLLQAGVVAALPHLKQLIARGKESWDEAFALAERMVKAWKGGRESRPKSAHRIEMLVALCQLKAAALLELFIADVITPQYEGTENEALISSVSVLGNESAAAVLSTFISKRMPNRSSECAEFLLALSEDASRCFPKVAESAISGIDRIGKREQEPQAEAQADEEEAQERRQTLSPQFLLNLLRSLRRFRDQTLCDTAASRIAARPEAFSPVTIVVPALQQNQTGHARKSTASDSGVEILWTGSVKFLLRRSESPPEPPSDWCLDVQLSCLCPDCRELQLFARNPDEQVHRFRVKKERRQHLHNAIDRNHLEMTHATERVGSPQTLVCTKDRRSFKRRIKEYGDEIAAMRTLLAIEQASEASMVLSSRMIVAIERASGRE